MGESQKVISWSAFKEFVSRVASSNSTMYCRGQSDERWRLTSSFHRRASKFQISLKDYLRYIVPEVHYSVSALLGRSFDLTNNQDLGAFLAILQHHGFPTPLLDWTTSPYIAAYFAFREVKDENHSSDNVRIFFFNQHAWRLKFQQVEDFYSELDHISLVRPDPSLNTRVAPQQGAFLFTTVSDVEGYLVASETKSSEKFLEERRMSIEERDVALRDLNMMGINESSLFPGLDGLCRMLTKTYMEIEVGESSGKSLRRLLSIDDTRNNA